MARKTRQLRELEVVDVLIEQGAILPCKRCRVAFTREDVKTGNIQNEHLHEHGLGGSDDPHNRAFSHTDCHKIVTFGNGATTAGSSINRHAKATHQNRTEKFVVNKRPLDRPDSVDPGARCRRCGEYGTDCKCPPSQVRSSFGRKSL